MVDNSVFLVPTYHFFLDGLFLVAGVFLLHTLWHLKAVKLLLRLRRSWQRGAAAPKSDAETQTRRPWCCSSWNSCSNADQELQRLVQSALRKPVGSLGPDFWNAAWRDLEELVEQGSLSCCSSANAQPENKRGASTRESDDNRQMRGPRCCSPRCNRCSKADQELQQLVQSALPEHIGSLGPEFWDAAWRDLEELVESGSLSCCRSSGVQSSTRRYNRAHMDCRTQPHRRPGLMATKPAQTMYHGGRAASRAGDPTEVCRPPAEECILRERILLPDGRLPQRPDNLVPLQEWAVNPPGLGTIKKEFPGQTLSRRHTGRPSGLSGKERLQVKKEGLPSSARQSSEGAAREQGQQGRAAKRRAMSCCCY